MEIAVLLAKDSIKPVPLAEMKKGFYSHYFIIPKKGGGLRPILDLTSFSRLCTICAELLETVQTQNSGTTKVFSEAPGAYGFLHHGDAAGVDAYESASALALGSSPEIGMVPRHTSHCCHADLSPFIQPFVRPCISKGRSSPITVVPKLGYA